jgi:hypothetical protein
MATTPAAGPVATARPTRPVAASVVMAVAAIAAGFSFWKGATILGDADGDRWQLAYGVFQLGLGVLALAVGLGALGVRSWAWELFMAWAVIGLASQILRHFFFDDATYVGMALYVVAVFALTPRDVQIAFGIRKPANAELERPTRNPLDRD